jgi:hypothetical protein
LLTREKAAAYLGGICLTTLSRLAIPQVKIRRRIFYKRVDVEKWIAKHTSKPEASK